MCKVVQAYILPYSTITMYYLLYNSLSISLSSLSLSNHLQWVQNCAAHLITHTYKREYITFVLFQLHWLPLYFNWQCKIPILPIQNTEQKSTTVSKWPDPKIYTSQSAAVVCFWECQKATQQCVEKNLSKHQLLGYRLSCQILLNQQQVEKIFLQGS